MEHLNDANLLWRPLYTIEEAEKIILGVPYGSSELGESNTLFVPNRIRELFRDFFWTYDIERRKDLFDLKIVDIGNVIPSPSSFEITSKRIENVIKWVLDKNSNVRFVFLGGEHSITFPIAKTLKLKSILSLDAHPDFCDTYEGFKYSIACVMRRIHELNCKVHLRGIRTASKEEHDFIINNKIDWKKDLDFKGKVDYLSIDVDVLDSSYASVSAPESMGFSVKDVINQIRNTEFKHCDIVEWIPDFGYPNVIQILKELLWK